MKERNRSIDIFRYICAILVVVIHTTPFDDVDPRIGYVVAQILPRIAVPFFFLVAGYYYIKALEDHKNAFLPYLLRFLKTYALWSAVYFAIDFIRKGHRDIPNFLVRCVFSFLTTGSYYHFWFFPALIFSVCLVTIFYRARLQKLILPASFILYVIGCLGCSYHSIGMGIPVLSTLFSSSYFIHIRRVALMAFPFFAAGLLIIKIQRYIKEHHVPKSVITFALPTAVICWLLEIAIVIHFQLQENIIITLGLYPLTVAVIVFLLHHPMPQAQQFSEKCHILADFTYYSHPLIITLLTFAAKQLGYPAIPSTLIFLLTVALTWTIGILFYYPHKRRTDLSS